MSLTKAEVKETAIYSGVGTATGTNIYTVTIPELISYTSIFRLLIKFTNTCTGPCTLNVNGLGAKIIYKGVSTPMVTGDIASGQIAELNYDGTNFQIILGVSIPSIANKVITTDNAGALQAINDLIDIISTTSEATLIAADWSTGSASVAGIAGTKVFGATYEYTCTGTGVWRRSPYNLIWNDLYLANVSDSGGVKTSTQMATLYPAAVQGQRARGSNGLYEYFGLFGWVYYPFTII